MLYEVKRHDGMTPMKGLDYIRCADYNHMILCKVMMYDIMSDYASKAVPVTSFFSLLPKP